MPSGLSVVSLSKPFMSKLILPFVTLILPVRNEGRFIIQALQSLLEQTYPHDRMEILVADGRSTDGTPEHVRQFAASHDLPVIHVIDNPKISMPAGFNIAMQHAHGDVIILIGGHSRLAVDYVAQCVEALERTGADCVGGPIETIGETGISQAIALAQSSWFGVGGAAFRMKDARAGFVDTVAFGAYRRSVFERIGLLDEELVRNQDDEFNFRLTQSGGKIWLDPRIRSEYRSRSSLSRLWKQYFDYGMYKVRVIQKRRAVPAWRHLIPGLFVASLLSGLIIFMFSRRKVWLLPAFAYVGADAVASIHTARQARILFPLLPIVFATLHFSYGLGFLYGIWRWRASIFSILSIKDTAG